MLPILKGPLPSIISTQPPPSDAELFLLRSIEWIIFSEATYDKALEQANHILRYFLGKWLLVLNRRSGPLISFAASGRMQLAKELLSLLPPELASISVDEMDVQATEYLHYRQFFTIWETLERVVECQALESPNMNRDTRLAWLEDYKVPTTSFLHVRRLTPPSSSASHRASARADLEASHF